MLKPKPLTTEQKIDQLLQTIAQLHEQVEKILDEEMDRQVVLYDRQIPKQRLLHDHRVRAGYNCACAQLRLLDEDRKRG